MTLVFRGTARRNCSGTAWFFRMEYNVHVGLLTKADLTYKKNYAEAKKQTSLIGVCETKSLV